MTPRNYCGRTRREMIWQTGAGFTGVALAGMLGDDFLSRQSVAADGATPWRSPLAPKKPHFPAKAKSVIFLYMYGGPSQIDTFDHKPGMKGRDNQRVALDTEGRTAQNGLRRIVEPRWQFRPYGKCGKMISDLFPNLGKHADDIAFLHSMTADSPIHGSAMIQMNTGKILSGSPAVGSWLNYGLGSENENLPGFVVMLDHRGGPISGAKNWSAGYMPAHYEGTIFRSQGAAILDLERPAGTTSAAQRHMLDTLKDYNDEHMARRAGNSSLAARIGSYELAFRMQTAAPEATDVEREPEGIKALYGLDDKKTSYFGRQCLLARRLVERGVRFIQIFSGGGHNDENWDAHGDLEKNHNLHAGETDKPMAGLIADLKQRGLLDSTLIVWGGEFGRQPTAEYAKGTGRDHNAKGFTMWMAGGGIKGGVSVGETDEFGHKAVVKPFHVKHLHATILNRMGMDPERLTYFYGGLDQKLVGVEGAEPIKEVLA